VTAASVETRTSATELVHAARRRLRWWDVSEGEIARVEREGTAQRTITIHAPVSGVVLEKNVTAGQRVMAGEVLYRVADLSSVWVDGEVYERDLGAIRAGQVVTATFDALPGASIAGRVAYVYPTLSPDTRTARVRVSLGNPDARLLPGMYATLRIRSDVRGASLSVPRGAVLATGTRHLVFVRLPNGQLEPRTVEIGAASDDRVAILHGVALGDTVVASATFLVDAESNLGTALGGMGDMPGMDMTIAPRAPSPAPAGPVSPAGPKDTAGTPAKGGSRPTGPARPPGSLPERLPARPPAPRPSAGAAPHGGHVP
jgi:RND family efflux transporter MFP subunit